VVPGVGIVDPNLAERGSRLGAALLDILIAMVCMGPGIGCMIAAGEDNESLKNTGITLIGIGMLALVIVQFYMLTTRGQTLGKKIVGVKIVRFADSSKPGFVHACLLRAIVPSLIANIPLLGLIFSIVDVCFIFGEERRCLHDLIAGTKVVKA
jgi:uncharacterized RDD family membrane protein YckC